MGNGEILSQLLNIFTRQKRWGLLQVIAEWALIDSLKNRVVLPDGLFIRNQQLRKWGLCLSVEFARTLQRKTALTFLELFTFLIKQALAEFALQGRHGIKLLTKPFCAFILIGHRDGGHQHAEHQ